MSSKDLQVGDPVWAKMKGYPPWPAKIAEPPSDCKGPKNKKAHYVFFFGSENFAWILEENISPHNEDILNTLSKKKPVVFQNAIEAIVKYSNTYVKKKQTPESRKKSENDLPAKKKGKQASEIPKDNISTPSKKKNLRFEEKESIQALNLPSVKENESSSDQKKNENQSSSPRKKKQTSEINVSSSSNKDEKQRSLEKDKNELISSPAKEKKLGSQEKDETAVDKKKRLSTEKKKGEFASVSKRKKSTSEEVKEIQYIMASSKKEQSEVVDSSSRKLKQTEVNEVENIDVTSSKDENVKSDETKLDDNVVSSKKRRHDVEGKEAVESFLTASNENEKSNCKEKGSVVASLRKQKEKNEHIVTVSKSNKHKQAVENESIVASSIKVEKLDSDNKKKNKNISAGKKTSVLRKNVKRASPVKSVKNKSQKKNVKASASKVPKIEPSGNAVNDNLPNISLYPCAGKEVNEEMSSEDLEDYELPSKLKFGFIGLGTMGKKIVTKFLQTGHDVTVWNKTLSVCDKFVPMGAKKAHFPGDLIVNCDVTFSCISGPDACKKIIFCEHGILEGFEKVRMLGQSNKGYVELSNIDPISSKLIAEAIDMKNGRYLEAPLVGSSTDVDTSTLIVIGAGNRSLFKDCISCFTSIAKRSIYISSEIGYGTSMSLIVNMLSGTVWSALAEAIALTERLKLQKEDFLDCLENGPLACKSLLEKAHMMIDSKFIKETALKLMQKDISLSLLIGDSTYTPTPVIAAANEVYKRARLSKYSEEDVSAVYKVAKY